MSQNDSSMHAIVYVQQKPASVRHADCLRPLGNVTILRHTLCRLASGLAEIGCSLVVLGHPDQFCDHIAEQVKGTGFQHELVDLSAPAQPAASDADTPFGFTLVDDLRSYVCKHDISGHLLVFPENCIFPDCVLTRALVEYHLESNSDCTLAPDYPFALVPVVFRAKALDRLPRFIVRAGDPSSVQAVEFLFSQLRHLARSPGFAISEDTASIRTFPYGEDSPPGPTELPLRMTVNDRFSSLAADRVQAHASTRTPDSASARRFKAELVSLYEECRPVQRRMNVSQRGGPVRVLFSSLRDAYSGPEQCLLSLMRGLDGSRFQPVLAVPRCSLLTERAADAGIDVEISDFAFDRCQPPSFGYWSRIIEQYDVKLVHLDLEVNAALIMAAIHHGIPTVGHVRTVVPQELPEPVYCVDRLIAISEFVAGSLRKTYFNPARVSVIHDGVDTSRLAARRLNGFLPGCTLRVGMVARMNPGKRQDLLLKAMALQRSSVCAYFYGEADPAAEEYSRMLFQLVREYGLENKVTFCGFESDINRMYGAFDVLVVCMPGEALGTCTLEALASGLPVIAPDAGGSREIVRHEEHGLLYTPNDAVSLANALSRFAKDPVLYEKLSINAEKYAESLSMERHVQKVEALYGEILAGVGGDASRMPLTPYLADFAS